jgi:hypothetical protein
MKKYILGLFFLALSVNVSFGQNSFDDFYEASNVMEKYLNESVSDIVYLDKGDLTFKLGANYSRIFGRTKGNSFDFSASRKMQRDGLPPAIEIEFNLRGKNGDNCHSAIITLKTRRARTIYFIVYFDLTVGQCYDDNFSSLTNPQCLLMPFELRYETLYSAELKRALQYYSLIIGDSFGADVQEALQKYIDTIAE